MGLKLFRSAKKRKKLHFTKAKRDLKTSWNNLLKKYGASPGKDVLEFQPLKGYVENMNKAMQLHSDRLPSRFSSLEVSALKSTPTNTKSPKYDGKMAAREAEAQKEIQRKKKMVAPLYNKGPAAYVAGYDPKDLGKKS